MRKSYKEYKQTYTINSRLRYERFASAKQKGKHTNKEWIRLCKEFDYRCVRCWRIEKLTKDHIIPISIGGDDSIKNIQPLCSFCNISKSDRNKFNWVDFQRKKKLIPDLQSPLDKTLNKVIELNRKDMTASEIAGEMKISKGQYYTLKKHLVVLFPEKSNQICYTWLQGMLLDK